MREAVEAEHAAPHAIGAGAVEFGAEIAGEIACRRFVSRLTPRLHPAAHGDGNGIAALDAEQAVLAPPPAARLRAAVAALAEGRADLALGFFWDTPDRVAGARPYDETYLMAGPPPLCAGPLTLEAYCAANHVLVSPAGDMRGIVDDRLEAMGRARRVVLGMPSFLPALAAAAGALVMLPARVAAAFAPPLGLARPPPPLDLRRFPVSVFWHRRNDADPRTAWLRQAIAAGAGA